MRELGRINRTYCSSNQTNWINYLSDIEDCCNSLPHSSTGYSPSELVTGRRPKRYLTEILRRYLPEIPGGNSLDDKRKCAKERLYQEANRQKLQQKSTPTRFKIGENVLLRTKPQSKLSEKINQKLCLLYEGPF